ncbi:MAG: SMC family ATPase [Gemmatimonadota bacterium]|nr:SMC family ATPase [Gemmatimonadota bacterium]
MRLVRLRLQNFRQHLDTTLEFERGLTGIIGPNGAGKSTILEAIIWALFGAHAARGGSDTIRALRAPARAPVRVELEFELAGHRYRVLRGLTTAELYLDGADAPVANSVRAVTEMVGRRLGMTRDEFAHTYFTGQKELALMQNLSAPDRGKFLSRVLGYERLRLAQHAAEERRKALTAELVGVRSALPDADALTRELAEARAARDRAAAEVTAAEAAVTAATTAHEAIAPRWAAVQAARETRERIARAIAGVEGELVGQAAASARLATEQAAAVEAVGALAPLRPRLDALPDVRARTEAQRTLRDGATRRRAIDEQRALLEADATALRAEQARLAAAAAAEVALTPQLEAAREALAEVEREVERLRTGWVRDRQDVDAQLRALRAQYLEVRDQRDRIVALGDASPCPTCTRPLGSHLADVVQVLESQMAALESNGTYFRQRAAELEPMPAALATQEAARRSQGEGLAALERARVEAQGAARQHRGVAQELATKTALLATLEGERRLLPEGYDAAGHELLEAELAALLQLERDAARLVARAERLPALEREAEGLEAGRRELEARREAWRAEATALQLPADGDATLQAAYEAARLEVLEAQQRAAAARLARETAAAEVDRATAALEASEVQRAHAARLEAERRLHEELVRVYGDLRTDLNAAMRPELSEIASGLISDLTDARYTELDLDDKYRIQLLEEGVPKPVISGGEEDLAFLVLRLAVSQMIADRAGQRFSLLVLDEVFGSLDDVRRQAVVSLLRSMEDRFEQVIVITHIDGVKDGLDRVITVGVDPRTGAARVATSTRGTADAEAFDGLAALAAVPS